MLVCMPPVDENSFFGLSEQVDSPRSSSKIPESSAVFSTFLFFNVVLLVFVGG